MDDTGADDDVDTDPNGEADGVKDAGSSDGGCLAVPGTLGHASLLAAILG